jgi:hypothetical protein
VLLPVLLPAPLASVGGDGGGARSCVGSENEIQIFVKKKMSNTNMVIVDNTQYSYLKAYHLLKSK